MAPSCLLAAACRYGYKTEATALLQEWVRDVGSTAGATASNTRLSSGYVGAPESRLEVRLRQAHACAPHTAQPPEVMHTVCVYVGFSTTCF